MGDLRTEGLGTAPICYDWNHCFCERERSSQCCDRRRHAWEALRMGCRVPGHDSVVDGSTGGRCTKEIKRLRECRKE